MKKMKNNLYNVKVISTGKYAPSKVVSNQDLEKIVDTSDEWIYSRTGIKNRRHVEEEQNSDLAYLAAQDAVNKVNYDLNKVDLIIVATFNPDMKCPSVANLVQAKLGLNDRDIMTFDINAACTGFVYALDVASAMLQSGKYKSALVIGSEIISRVLNYEDRNTCVLFGDGAGAIILEHTEETKPAFMYCASRGDVDGTLHVKDYVVMDGKKVYQFATNAMNIGIQKALEAMDLNIDDIDCIIPHQANIRIIQSVAKHLKIDMDRFYINIDQYGNTSAASIILALDEYLTQNKKQNQKILLVGFGGGFTWGSAILTI